MTLSTLFVCVAVAAWPQEVKDGVFTHKEHQIQFTVPKDWTVRAKDFEWKWTGALAEVVSTDSEIGGVLQYEGLGMNVDRYADAMQKSVQNLKGMTSYTKLKEEKLDRKVGAWLRCEYKMDFNGNQFRRVVIYINNGKHNFTFSQWCFEEKFDDFKAAIYKNANSLVYGELADAKPDPGK